MRESEYLCISFNSPGTRQTSLPQPSVQDRITHIITHILDSDAWKWISVHFIQFTWYQTDILTPTLGTGQNHPYTGLRCVKVNICKVNICAFHSIHLVPDRHAYPNPRYRTESPIYWTQMRESEYLCISFNSPGTRQTSLPQPLVQDRITHIITHIIIDVREKHHLINWTNWIFAGTPSCKFHLTNWTQMHESEYLCISFNSSGTRQTCLPQPSVQDRITHIITHILDSDAWKWISVHFIQFSWYQTDILTPTLGTGQNHPYTVVFGKAISDCARATRLRHFARASRCRPCPPNQRHGGVAVIR
jgi:hypothetical protein